MGDVTEASLDSFPKSTTVIGSVTGAAAAAEVLTGKVKVNWHLKPLTLMRLRIELKTLTPPDESDEDPDAPEWAAIEGIEQAKKEAQAQLGTWVGGSMQGVVTVASFVVPTDPLDILLPVGGKVFKTLKFAEKARGAYAPVVNKFLDSWRAKRIARGKSPNVAVRYAIQVTNGGQKGTKTPGVNYEPSEAGEVVKYGSRLGHCFVAGTPVVMADGTTKSIEDVKKGDEVMSRDEVTGETATKKVVQTFERLALKTVVLRFAGGERIECTPEHPFYVEDRGFVQAGELGIGTHIVTRAGPSVEIESICDSQDLI